MRNASRHRRVFLRSVYYFNAKVAKGLTQRSPRLARQEVFGVFALFAFLPLAFFALKQRVTAEGATRLTDGREANLPVASDRPAAGRSVLKQNCVAEGMLRCGGSHGATEARRACVRGDVGISNQVRRASAPRRRAVSWWRRNKRNHTMEDMKWITPKDLKPGQEKVVVYKGPNGSVIVPDPSWDMTGNLSRVPGRIRKRIDHYSKNGFTKRQDIVDSNTPVGSKISSDIKNQGYSIDDRQVTFSEETDWHGSLII